MRIKSPLTDKKEVRLLCEAGADELFCGIEPYIWKKRYKDFCINQRTTGANFTKLSDLEKAISLSHNYKRKVHVAVNAFFYLEEQYEMAERIIKDVLDIGADGIIFGDPGLLSRLNMNGNIEWLKGKDVVIGCDAVVFNSYASKFYKRLGGTRMVFPRAMMIKEMEEIVKSDRACEYEVFIIHDLCFFVDGFCTYCKEQTGNIEKRGRGKRGIYFFVASRLPMRGYGGGCRTVFRRQKISVEDNLQVDKNKSFRFWMDKHIQGCGACAIYDLKRIGINVLKVLDRNLPTEEKVRATEFIKKSLSYIEGNNLSKLDYIERCKGLFKKTFKIRCNQYDCYYPDAIQTNQTQTYANFTDRESNI